MSISNRRKVSLPCQVDIQRKGKDNNSINTINYVCVIQKIHTIQSKSLKMFLSSVNGGKKCLAKQHSWPRVLGPYTRTHNHKLYPDQTLVGEINRLQSMVIMCKCEFTVHAHYQPCMTALAAATAHTHTHTGCIPTFH